MKILITGAPGWLGNILVESLIKEKHKVRCLVLKDSNYQELKKMGAECVEGNLTEAESLKEIAKGIDVVVHAAGIIHPKKICELYLINTRGTKYLLNEAVNSGVKKFVYISSNSPAGCNKNRNKLMKENDRYNPYMNYGRSKMLAEKIVMKAYQDKLIETVIIRPCWFYGPGQPARQTTFFKMIQKGNPIVFGDGKNLRSMSYIYNLVDGIKLAIKSKKANGETYWIADKKPYTTNEIYGTVAKIFNVELKPRFIPGISSEICKIIDTLIQSVGFYQQEFHVAGEMNKDIACSIEKAEKELGYKPKVALEQGMKESIAWCKKKGLL